MEKVYILNSLDDSITTEYCSIRDDDNIERIEVTVMRDKVDALLGEIIQVPNIAKHGGRINIDDLCEAIYFDAHGNKVEPQYHAPPTFELIFGEIGHGTITLSSESRYCGKDDSFEITFK